MNPELLTRLETQLDSLELFTASEEEFSHKPIPEKWSAHENLAHLGHYHEVFLERLKRMASEEEPEFTRFKPDADPGFLAWAAKEPSEVLAGLNSERSSLLDFLNEQPSSYFERTGKHPLYGVLIVQEWLELFLLHEAHHLYVALLRLRS